VITRPGRQNNPATSLQQTCLQKRADQAELSLGRDYAASYTETPAHQHMYDLGMDHRVAHTISDSICMTNPC